MEGELEERRGEEGGKKGREGGEEEGGGGKEGRKGGRERGKEERATGILEMEGFVSDPSPAVKLSLSSSVPRRRTATTKSHWCSSGGSTMMCTHWVSCPPLTNEINEGDIKMKYEFCSLSCPRHTATSS